MVERDVRLDAVRAQLVDQIVVELHSLLVDPAAQRAVGQQPRPRDREAVVLQAERRGELHVLFHPMVVVACEGDCECERDCECEPGSA